MRKAYENRCQSFEEVSKIFPCHFHTLDKHDGSFEACEWHQGLFTSFVFASDKDGIFKHEHWELNLSASVREFARLTIGWHSNRFKLLTYQPKQS